MNGITGWWVGIDVSKSKLDVAVLDERGKVKSHVFDNAAKGLEALIAWLRQRGCDVAQTRVCMEATGPYSEAVSTTLSDAGWYVSVVNPSRIKGFAQSEMSRNKTDKADAALRDRQSGRRALGGLRLQRAGRRPEPAWSRPTASPRAPAMSPPGHRFLP